MKTFEDLFAELRDKAATRPAGSGTVAELDRGVHFIGKKLVEEAAEVLDGLRARVRRGRPARRSANCSTTPRS